MIRSGDLHVGLLLSTEGQPVVARWRRAQASPALASRRRLLCLGMHLVFLLLLRRLAGLCFHPADKALLLPCISSWRPWGE